MDGIYPADPIEKVVKGMGPCVGEEACAIAVGQADDSTVRVIGRCGLAVDPCSKGEG